MRAYVTLNCNIYKDLELTDLQVVTEVVKFFSKSREIEAMDRRRRVQRARARRPSASTIVALEKMYACGVRAYMYARSRSIYIEVGTD